MTDPNPYLAPKTTVADWQESTSDAVAVREQHIRHEVLLKSVGSLYWLGAFGCALGALATVMAISNNNAGGESMIVLALMIGFYGCMGVASAVLGWGFRALKPWVKIPATILSGIGLLGIPLGTLINGYILYLIWCDKGKRVLTDDYASIIAQTPEVKYKRTVGDWIAVGFLVLLLLVFVVAVAVGYFSAR